MCVVVPLRLPVEQRAGRVDVDHLLVDERAVSLLRILFGRVPEEATADGFLDAHRCFATRHHVQFMPDREESTCELCLKNTQ